MGQLFDKMTAGLPPNPNRGANWMAVGSGLSQLAQGGPVDLSQHYERIQQNKGMTGAIESLREELGPERYKALLNAPPAIQKAIVTKWYEQQFSGPSKPQFLSGPNGAQYRVVTGADGNISYELAIPGKGPDAPKPKDTITTVDGRAYYIGPPGQDGIPTLTPLTLDNAGPVTPTKEVVTLQDGRKEVFWIKPGAKPQFAGTIGTASPAKPNTPNSWDEFVLGMPQGMPENELRARYHEWLMERARASGGLGPNIGALQPGEVAIEDSSVEGGYRITTMPGSKAERDAAAAEAEAAAEESAAGFAEGQRDTVTEVIFGAATKARDAASKRKLEGAPGLLASVNPANENARLYREVASLKAQSRVENLLAMKQASPTGASGFGQLSEQEGKALEARAGALDPASPYFEEELADYTLAVLRFVHGHEVGTAMFDAQWEDTTPTGNKPPPRQGTRDPASLSDEEIKRSLGLQ